jgi:Holliday junction DNA helicase RuvA
MIAYLRGVVREAAGSEVVLDVQGVGYSVFCTARLLGLLTAGEEVEITVHTDVREDSIQLYGFADLLEKRVFSLLTTVKGVGSKSASEIVSRIDVRELLRAIAGGDVGALQRIKGIGKKTAERIVVELKDRVGEFVQSAGPVKSDQSGLLIEVESAPLSEAMEALCALGFPRSEAEMLVGKVDLDALAKGSDASAIVRQALRFV